MPEILRMPLSNNANFTISFFQFMLANEFFQLNEVNSLYYTAHWIGLFHLCDYWNANFRNNSNRFPIPGWH